jgi:hypothetical protein
MEKAGVTVESHKVHMKIDSDLLGGEICQLTACRLTGSTEVVNYVHSMRFERIQIVKRESINFLPIQTCLPDCLNCQFWGERFHHSGETDTPRIHIEIDWRFNRRARSQRLQSGEEKVPIEGVEERAARSSKRVCGGSGKLGDDGAQRDRDGHRGCGTLGNI